VTVKRRCTSGGLIVQASVGTWQVMQARPLVPRLWKKGLSRLTVIPLVAKVPRVPLRSVVTSGLVAVSSAAAGPDTRSVAASATEKANATGPPTAGLAVFDLSVVAATSFSCCLSFMGDAARNVDQSRRASRPARGATWTPYRRTMDAVGAVLFAFRWAQPRWPAPLASRESRRAAEMHPGHRARPSVRPPYRRGCARCASDAERRACRSVGCP
jgi:hypothetical protein